MNSREQIYKAALEEDVERGKYQPWGRARGSDVVVQWKCLACHNYFSPVVLVDDAGYCKHKDCPSSKARAALEAAAKVGDQPKCSCQLEIGDGPCERHPICQVCELVFTPGADHKCTGIGTRAIDAYLRGAR